MAPSFRDLIDFLLAEIALCGDQGACPADILAFIDVFYTQPANDASDRSQAVDRRFQEKVWQWLTKNPEVSVGKNREGNHLTLGDAEQRGPETEDVKEGSKAALARSDNGPARVFVSKERTWLAVTGHEPDDTKVLPTEFALLSIIASRKSDGIVQTELVRLSGQDKRSVPKRTEVLQQKGYIDKRAIQIKSARTSLCTLRKFLKPEIRSNQTPADQVSSVTDGKNRMIDFKQFTDKLFEILLEYKIVSRNDLKDLLGFADHWRWRILSRALRKFERIGVLKRVKALSQYADTMKKFHPCIMLIREPTEKDIDLFYEYSRSIYTNLEQGVNADFDEELEADDTAREPVGGTVGRVKEEGAVEESGRILPVWTPDRSIHNQIFDVIDSSGVTGTTNVDVIRACFGGFYRRPLENTLVRLVECWQLSQPPHLRHLAIVRDTALHRTITHYVHYSARNFSKLVEAGESSWEAVEFVPKNAKVDNIRVPPIDAKPSLDQYGLPLEAPKKELLKNGDATLLDCILVVKPPDYLRSSSDPVAMKREDGTFAIHHGHKKLPAGMSNNYKPSGYNGRSNGTPSRPKIDYDDVSDVNMDDVDILSSSRFKRSRQDPERFQGMSELEKLKALGLDETWTEYSVLLIDRPSPGVYVTTKGRRRPAGKRQGRPRISRLAVFKTPRLSTLPWFQEKQGQPSEVASLSEQYRPSGTEGAPVSVPGADGPFETPSRTALGKSGAKRSFQQRISDDDSDPGTVVASKSLRTNDEAYSQNNLVEVSVSPRVTGEEIHRQSELRQNGIVPGKGVKRRRGNSPEPEITNVQDGGVVRMSLTPAQPREEATSTNPPAANETMETPSKKSRRADPKSGGRKVSPLGPTETSTSNQEVQDYIPTSLRAENPPQAGMKLSVENTLLTEDTSSQKTSPTTQETADKILNEATTTRPQAIGPPAFETPRQASMVSAVSQTPEGSVPKGNRLKPDKGGSVSFLRRKIVMDVLEKAGGAYPMGTEIWYPFMTAWMKTKYKEKPDLRTIKATIKHMVDAGKLRQQTFCGRDRKGIMVTKTIVCKSDLQPDDQAIKELQEKILNCETRYYFPPNVEVDPELIKGVNKATPGKIVRITTEIPVESGLTVQLHQKPAAVLAVEKRRGQSIQRRLLQRIEMERSAAQKQRASGVVRLLTIQRADSNDRLMHSMTSISRPDHTIDEEKRRRRRSDGQGLPGGPRRQKRSWRSISSMAPYAMLMNPKQIFHPGTGTFSTNAGITALNVSKYHVQRQPTQKLGPRLPSSLDDLFSQTRRRTLKENEDVQSRRFFRDNNAILRWELQHEELFQKKTADLRYINQTVQDAFVEAPVEGAIRFDDGWREEQALPLSMTTRQQTRRSSSVSESSSNHSLSPEPDRMEIDSVRHIDTPDNFPQAPTIFRHRRLEKLNDLMGASEEAQTPTARQLIRRNRLQQPLAQSTTQRIMAAIVVVRALAGGLDGKLIDWTLVTRCFPNLDAKFIQDRGKGILNKHRLQLSKMQSDFQERFIEAYAAGQVPPINYDDLGSYDWGTVIDWADTQLDVPKSEKVPDLPATREQFDSVFELREEAITSLDDIYQGSQSVTMNRKRAMFASIPYSAPLESKRTRNSARQAELSYVEVAKTWIRANVVTPEETYRPAVARDALSHFPNEILRSALQSLVTERVISQGNRGRVTPGRNYDITEHFLYVLSKKRAIEGTELLRASRYKTNTLDTALASKGVLDVEYGAEDGDILALINLFAEGRITLHARDPPRDKFGLTDGGYLTRQMNKDKLRFPVKIRPVETKYVDGDPIREKAASVPPPRPSADVDLPEPLKPAPDKIPLWYDVHGQFVKVLWDLAAAAVVGCVATRPGITAEGISSMVKPTMGAWEALLMLEWLMEVGVVGQEGSDMKGKPGWAVKEWWWMILS